jgi:hypothetical protein
MLQSLPTCNWRIVSKSNSTGEKFEAYAEQCSPEQLGRNINVAVFWTQAWHLSHSNGSPSYISIQLKSSSNVISSLLPLGLALNESYKIMSSSFMLGSILALNLLKNAASHTRNSNSAKAIPMHFRDPTENGNQASRGGFGPSQRSGLNERGSGNATSLR